jgi:hypothetical protein
MRTHRGSAPQRPDLRAAAAAAEERLREEYQADTLVEVLGLKLAARLCASIEAGVGHVVVQADAMAKAPEAAGRGKMAIHTVKEMESL